VSTRSIQRSSRASSLVASDALGGRFIDVEAPEAKLLEQRARLATCFATSFALGEPFVAALFSDDLQRSHASFLQ